ncbi:MAG TPA: hypothetical protein VLV25_09480 [Steroidobacteraceae bacterium]|nr:hypothetical protein [Steroidobacteraceae bacterium]
MSRSPLVIALATLAAGHAAAADSVPAPASDTGCPGAVAWDETHKNLLPEARGCGG